AVALRVLDDIENLRAVEVELFEAALNEHALVGDEVTRVRDEIAGAEDRLVNEEARDAEQEEDRRADAEGERHESGRLKRNPAAVHLAERGEGRKRHARHAQEEKRREREEPPFTLPGRYEAAKLLAWLGRPNHALSHVEPLREGFLRATARRHALCATHDG